MNRIISQSNKIPVVIMAGGLGTRAKTINSIVPKPLIPINGKPVLQYEIECLASQGYTDIILTVSYKAEQIIDYFGDGSSFGCSIKYFNEEQPLGNAGALFKLMEQGQPLSSESGVTDFLLLNADSMFDIDFDRFVNHHLSSGALATLFTHPSNHIKDSGLIVTDEQGWVTSWLAKEDPRPEYYHNCANAGLHVLNTEVLKLAGIDADKIGTVDEATGKIIKVDLDRQILKPLAGTGKMLAVSSPEYVKDMGTPERFEQVCTDLTSGLVHSRNLKNPQKAVFLDRDGTINRYVGFLRNIDQLELLPTSAEAVRLINESGFLAIVVTNQPVIARGEVSWPSLHLIHNKLETLLGSAGAYVDGIYICPHHPDSGFAGEVKALKIDCSCRKPKPGLIYRASADFNIDLTESYMIGDSWRDVQCGQAAGVKGTILLTGEGTESSHSASSRFDISSVSTVSRSASSLSAGSADESVKMSADEKSEIKSGGSGTEEEKVETGSCGSDYLCDNLLEAVKKILQLTMI